MVAIGCVGSINRGGDLGDRHLFMGKITKIQQQEYAFRGSISFQDWQILERSKSYYEKYQLFMLYHNVTFEYYTDADREKFVKKWWSKVMSPSYKIEDIRRNLPLTENKINLQKATFSINWDSAAWKIVNRVADLVETHLMFK